jgi:hypothetical protein
VRGDAPDHNFERPRRATSLAHSRLDRVADSTGPRVTWSYTWCLYAWRRCGGSIHGKATVIIGHDTSEWMCIDLQFILVSRGQRHITALASAAGALARRRARRAANPRCLNPRPGPANVSRTPVPSSFHRERCSMVASRSRGYQAKETMIVRPSARSRVSSVKCTSRARSPGLEWEAFIPFLQRSSPVDRDDQSAKFWLDHVALAGNLGSGPAEPWGGSFGSWL